MKSLVVICIALISYASGFGICNKPLDVVLVVEDSSFLPTGGDTKLQSFLASIVNSLTIGQQFEPNPFDQVAYVQYNSYARTIFHLNTYQEYDDAGSAVLTQPFSRRYADAPPIDQALRYLHTNELTVTNGKRSCYGTVVILVSYSSYNDPNANNDPNAPTTTTTPSPAKKIQERADLTAARNLINHGALLITIGVGNKRNAKHLQKLASSPNYYFAFQTFDHLTDDAAVNIAQRVCTFVPSGNYYPCEMQTVQADFTFVVDISNAFNARLAEDISAFMRNFLSPYTYDHSDGVQASLVTYGSTSQVAVGFRDADDLDQFLYKANSSLDAALQCPACRTEERCIGQALQTINYNVLVPPHFRPMNNTVHYVYIFTAGCFNCKSTQVTDPIDLANLIKKGKNVEIFVLPLQNWKPVGGSAAYPCAYWKEPEEIATDLNHLIEVQADPASILRNDLHKQAWRSVCVSQSRLPNF